MNSKEKVQTNQILPFSDREINAINNRYKLHDKTLETSNELIFRIVSELIVYGFGRKQMKKKYYPEIVQECLKFYYDSYAIYCEPVQIERIFEYISKCFMCYDPCSIYAYVHKLRRILEISDRYKSQTIEVFLNSNIIQQLIQYLKNHYLSSVRNEIFDKLHYEIIFALHNMLSNVFTADAILDLLAGNGVIEILVSLMNDFSQTSNIEHVLFLLEMFARDFKMQHARDRILKSGYISAVQKFVHYPEFAKYLTHEAMGVITYKRNNELSTLTTDKNSTLKYLEKVDKSRLQCFLLHIIYSFSFMVSSVVEWPEIRQSIEILGYLSQLSLVKNYYPAVYHLLHIVRKECVHCNLIGKTFEFLRIIDENGLLNMAINCLKFDSPLVRLSAILLENIMNHADYECIDICLKYGLLSSMRGVLIINRRNVRVCSITAKITAGTKEHIQRVINAGLIREMFDIIKRNEKYKALKKEAIRAITNAAKNGSDRQIKILVNYGLIDNFSVLYALFFDDGIFPKVRGKFLRIIIEKNFTSICKAVALTEFILILMLVLHTDWQVFLYSMYFWILGIINLRNIH